MILSVKVKASKRAENLLYKNKIDTGDYKLVAIVLKDLERMGIDIKKATKLMDREEMKNFPWK